MNRSKITTIALILAGFIISVFVTMLLFNVSDYGITIASFGVTAFMILTRKNLSKRKVFGAYLIATLIGFLASILPTITSFNVALATVVSFIVLSALKFEHIPALGLSIAVVLNKFSFWTDVIIVLCIFAILGLVVLIKSLMTNPDQVLNYIQIENEKINWNF